MPPPRDADYSIAFPLNCTRFPFFLYLAAAISFSYIEKFNYANSLRGFAQNEVCPVRSRLVPQESITDLAFLQMGNDGMHKVPIAFMERSNRVAGSFRNFVLVVVYCR